MALQTGPDDECRSCQRSDWVNGTHRRGTLVYLDQGAWRCLDCGAVNVAYHERQAAKAPAREKAAALSAARDRVIEAARAWARHPTHPSLRDALIAQVEALEALEARDA